jgi:hypothetical protein
MEGASLKGIVLGFLAGVIATVTVHEVISYLLLQGGYYPRIPWSMTPAAITGIPQIASDVLWGGLWGAIFALILGNAPTGALTFKGIVLGLLGPALMGGFLLEPHFTGHSAYQGSEPALVGAMLLMAAGFGAATAWLYGLFSYGRLP